MIERDIVQYLQADSDLIQMVSGANHLVVVQAPVNIKMPYITIEPIGGSRTRISPLKTEELNTVRISIDYGPDQLLSGRLAIERAKYLLENFRGTMNGAEDLLITCSSISSWSGLGGSYRSQFTAKCQFIENTTKPI